MGNTHCDPDKLFGLRVVDLKVIYCISVLATLFWLLLLLLSIIIPLYPSPAPVGDLRCEVIYLVFPGQLNGAAG